MQAEKRNNQKPRRKKRRLKKGVYVILFLPVAVLIVLSLTVFFPVETIKVQGESIYSPQDIVASSGIKQGDNMFWQLFNGSKKKLKLALPYVKTINYRYSFPGTIILSVSPYKPEYQFVVDNKYVLVASDGTVLEVKDQQQENLPTIDAGSMKYKLCEKISFPTADKEKIYQTLQKAAEDTKIEPNLLNLADPMRLQLQIGRTEVELGSDTYLEEKIHMVGKMIAQIPEGEAGTIDVSEWLPENKKGNYVKSEIT